MKKPLLFLCAFTSVTMLLAVFAVMRSYVSLLTASLAVLGAFSLMASFMNWRRGKEEVGAIAQRSSKNGNGLLWLLLIFTLNAVIALIQALHDGWDTGDTIGSISFAVFASLSIYEILRRRRRQPLK